MKSYILIIQVKPVFPKLLKRDENYYVLNKAEYQRTVTSVHSLLLNYQPKYNFNRNYQSNGVSNHLMFAQRGKLCTTKATEDRRSRDPG